MRAIALDAQPEDLGSQFDEAWVVLTERLQLARSNPAEVEDIPQQHDWAPLEAGVERNRLASRGGQREARRLVAYPHGRRALTLEHVVRGYVDPEQTAIADLCVECVVHLM